VEWLQKLIPIEAGASEGKARARVRSELDGECGPAPIFLGVKLVQVIGYRDGNYTAVPNAGQLYTWNWENLKKLLG